MIKRKDDEMGGTRSTHGKYEKFIQPEGKRELGRPKRM
jgi:hypothetical protein